MELIAAFGTQHGVRFNDGLNSPATCSTARRPTPHLTGCRHDPPPHHRGAALSACSNATVAPANICSICEIDYLHEAWHVETM